MAYPKNSRARYTNFKGINEKSSRYTTDNAQCLFLKNLDFYVPNAWQSTPGSTQGLVSGTSFPIIGLFEYQKLSGESYLLIGAGSDIFRKTPGNTLVSISSGWSNGQYQDMLTFVNKAWIASGQKTISYDGVSAFNFGLPAQFNRFFSDAQGFDATFSAFSVLGVTVGAPAGLTSTFKAVLVGAYAYIRSDGYLGPLELSRAISPLTPDRTTPGFSNWVGLTQGNFGNNVTLTLTGFTASSSLGLSGYAIFLALDTFTGLTGSFGFFGLKTGSQYNARFYPGNENLLKLFTTVPFGTTQITISGITLSWSELSSELQSFSLMTTNFFVSYTPKYMEINQNSLFISGFSGQPSYTWFSNIAEPEVYEPENFFETRTNDGDVITGLKTFQNQLLIFKRKSFSKLVGSDPSTYQLVELSTEYGCLSNRAIVEFNNNILFLDENGIIQYNGANWEIISDPIEPTLRTMNVNAAYEQAVAVHYIERKQIWFGIPVNGSTVNNLTVIYDYLLGAWTFVDGFNPCTYATVKQYLTKSTVWYGNYSGMVYYMSPSFYSHNGSAFTCVVETAFDAPDGQDVENMFRRLFLDVNTATGVTGVINVKVKSNYDRQTVNETFSIFQNQFQTRVDFGVPGKAIGFEFLWSNVSLPLLINGYDVQRRYLRNV